MDVVSYGDPAYRFVIRPPTSSLFAPMEDRNTQFALRCRHVVTPQGTRPATVRIHGNCIVGVDAYEAPFDAVDLGEHVLLPGLIDPHVHFNEPGRGAWEGLAHGTAAAAAGGITTVVDMPLNSSPVTTTRDAVEAKRSAAKGVLSADVALWGGLIPENTRQLGDLLDAGVRGLKVFLCDSGLDEFPASTERELRAAMPLLAERDAPLLVHAELVRTAPTPVDPRSYAQYAASRPPAFEQDAINLMIDLCRETGCRTHIVHLADAGSLPALAAAKAEGLSLTVETCPHYLTFASEEIGDGATQFKCAPPIRDAANRESLWQGLVDGVIDFIATDHSPCPPTMKHLDSGRFDLAWGGISSLQLLLPAVWTEASRRNCSLDDLAHWLCHQPALLPGLPAGIAPGMPANLVEFDQAATFVVQAAELHHRHAITPYDNRTLHGDVRRVWLRGALPTPGRGRMMAGTHDE